MVRIGRSAVFVGAGRPLELWEQEVADAPPGGLLVCVTMAGVCGSDLHRLGGDTPRLASLRTDGGDPSQGNRDTVAFGHEGVGIVEQLGEGVTTDWARQPLRVGDPVYWQPVARCGHCLPCATHPTGMSCDNMAWPPAAATANPATFQQYATLSPSVPVYRIPEDTPLDSVIAFGCAMPTVIGGFSRLGKLHAEETVVIQGSGPVGLAATMLAALSHARQVVVIGAGEARLAAARRLGATATLSIEEMSPEERHQAILDLTDGRGADAVIEAAGQLPAVSEGFNMLADHGRYLVIGMYSGTGTVAIDPYRLNNYNLRIIGSIGTEPAASLRTIHLAQRHHERLGLSGLVTHRFPLAQTAQAIASVRNSGTIKAVVMPDA